MMQNIKQSVTSFCESCWTIENVKNKLPITKWLPRYTWVTCSSIYIKKELQNKIITKWIVRIFNDSFWNMQCVLHRFLFINLIYIFWTSLILCEFQSQRLTMYYCCVRWILSGIVITFVREEGASYFAFLCLITKTCLFKYTEKFTTKKWKFDILHISVQTIDCGTLRTHNLCFWAEIRK